MEPISAEDLEKYATNFDSIKDCFDEKYREKLLNHFQENLRKTFALDRGCDQVSLTRAKFSMWKFNWQILHKHLEVVSASTASITEDIITNLLSLSEQSLKAWEKEQSKKETIFTELLLKKEETSTTLLASESLEKQLSHLKAENRRLAGELQLSQDELASTLELLQKENKTFLHKIIALSKQTADTSVSSTLVNKVRKEITPKVYNNTIIMNNRIAQGRELSFKQLKETIEDVYATKLKYDEKCRESRAPLETIDQYMFTFLNQKFGLKTIITEWTFAIMKAVTRYENEDAEIRLFSKVIKHKVNEDFQLVLNKVKEKLRALLKTCLANNSSYMRESQVAALLKEKTHGRLEDREWTSVVSLLYSQEEAEYILAQVRESLGKRGEGKTKEADSGILYSEFQNVVLGYDLNSHEILLEPFCRLFSEVDGDTDGILSRSEFLAVCDKMTVSSKEELLEKIDPFNTGKITFSMCVKLFSEEVVADTKGNFSLLHSLFFSNHQDN